MSLVHRLFKYGIVAKLVKAFAIDFIDRLVEDVFTQDLSWCLATAVHLAGFSGA